MKKKSTSRSAFLNLRVSLGVATLFITAFLALFAGTTECAFSRGYTKRIDAQMRDGSRIPSGYVAGVRQAWVAAYTGVFDDEPTAMAVDGAGNVYVTGYTGAPDSYHYVTIKYNASGQEEWVSGYNLPNGISFANAIAVDHGQCLCHGNKRNVWIE